MWRWTLYLNSGTKRSFDAAVAVGDNLYSFGEQIQNYNLNVRGDGDQIAVHVFNTVALRWIQLPPVTTARGECPPEVPSSRVHHTAVLIEEVVYVWGGAVKFRIQEDVLCIYKGHVSNVLYAFDVDTHRWLEPKVSGTVPAERESHSACVLGKVMYIYGGSCKTVNTNDIYKFDTTTMVWSSINARGTPPPALSGHSATIIGTKMFVVGGWNHQGEYNNIIRVFDMETNCWLSTPSAKLLPEERWGHSAFAYNGELYIVGGSNKQLVKGVWKFNPETFSWKKVEPKGEPPLGMSGVSCCMVGDRIILFRRFRVRDTHSDLYILDLSPPLKTLCKLAVIQYDLEQSELPHDIRWELAAMTANRNR